MSSQTTTQMARGNGRQRGRGGNRRRGSNGRGASKPQANVSDSGAAGTTAAEEKKLGVSTPSKSAETPVDESEVCWICAEPVKYYSVSDCDHRTCHVCALRLRALYKNTNCTFCKAPQPTVIFTLSPDAEFLSFTPNDIPYKDSKLGIFFETEAMMEETLILLRFNCPDSACDYIGSGWGDMKLHVRATHGRMMCDLCIRFKKVFSHEHALYPPNILPVHLPSLPHRSTKSISVEQIEGGIHPLCQFCRECFFSDDELYTHMRERHEECFVCKRLEIRDQYFKDYENLEKHFTHAHHPCSQPQCQARKFVVFSSALDLKGHMVDEHGADMTSRDKKDARRVQADFEFDEVGIGGRRNRRDRGGGSGGGNGDRDPPQHNPFTGPSRQNSRRREGFGVNLTVDGGTNTPAPPGSSRLSPSPPPEDPILAERHSAFTDRLRSLAPHPTTAVPAVKAAMRGFRASESSARDLISTLWTILDQNLDETASVVNAVVDLLEEEDKKKELLNSWNGFKIEQRRQFPDLVPTSVGSGYAGIMGGRVLNAKHCTASRSSQQSRQLWDRVAQAAGSSSFVSTRTPAPIPRPPERFPALQPALPTVVPAFRQASRNTPWSPSSASGFRAPSSVSGPGATEVRTKTPAQVGAPTPLSNALFPELPTSSSMRQKASMSGNQSLKKILGEATPVGSAWSSGTVGLPLRTADEGESSMNADAVESGKAKKKGKQKQTLFTLGTFPT